MKNYKILENKVLYLNTEANCTKVSNGTNNVEFIWNIAPISIDEFARFKVFSLAHNAVADTNHDDKVLTFRLKNVLYNPSTYYATDNSSYPIVFSMPFTTESQYWNADLGGINIIPQTLNTVSIVVSDDLTNPYNGINPNIQFMIGCVIEQYDAKLSEVGNPYGEANRNR